MLFFLSAGLFAPALSLYGQFEGRVIYDIVYETDNPELKPMLSMFPKKSELIISGANHRFQQNISGGGQQVFINNEVEKTNTLVMSFMGESFKVHLTYENVKTLENNPTNPIIHSSDNKTILGYTCQHAFTIQDKDTLQFYYNPDIYKGNMIPQFKGLEGLVLEYETLQNGLRMSFVATQILEEPISADWFEISDAIKEVSFEDFARVFAFKKES